ncbi:tetratricopeptide repeat protein 28-like [Acomys russatus]|uniref:tetratricopeptide repeat protein 28-like n=1 Tax=Acomys russatus TaxID=60746 RepID=UPI0021E27B61|nr:tetratricopeptide repeat protein 28-like [Acomys russatus]
MQEIRSSLVKGELGPTGPCAPARSVSPTRAPRSALRVVRSAAGGGAEPGTAARPVSGGRGAGDALARWVRAGPVRARACADGEGGGARQARQEHGARERRARLAGGTVSSRQTPPPPPGPAGMEQPLPLAPEPASARSRRRREPESPPAPIPLFGAKTIVQRSPDEPTLSKAEFVEKVRQSNQACHDGDFHTAIALYNEALAVDPQNCILYSNRSAAHMKTQQYQRALDDAIQARLLNPKWPKAYFRQGVALQYLGRHADALAAFASGLAQDPKSLQLLVGMVEAAMKSPMRDTLEPTYQQLQKMKLDKSPFVVVSVVGQELLTAGHHGASVVVLEAALKIGTCSLKLRGSVFSALSSAHWSLGNTEKSTGYMQQDLDVAKTLGDQTGECRAHGNLGSAFFSKGNYREALTNHRHQLVLAMKLKDREVGASLWSALPPSETRSPHLCRECWGPYRLQKLIIIY